MAQRTLSEAARVAGVACATLHRAMNTHGRLRVEADGRLATAERWRAGSTRQGSTHQGKSGALQAATPRASDAQHPGSTVAIQPLLAVPQERDRLRLARALWRWEREAAQGREPAAWARAQEARDERQAARARAVLLVRMLEQMQQRTTACLACPAMPRHLALAQALVPRSPERTRG